MKTGFFVSLLAGALAFSPLPALAESSSQDSPARKGIVQPLENLVLKTPDYHDITTFPIQWKTIDKGLEFTNFDVYRGRFTKELVDRVAAVRINPQHQRINVFTGYHGPENTTLRTIEEWQKHTGATVLFNSAQYEAHPYWQPCGKILTQGRTVGWANDARVRGMLVSEPRAPTLPLADILDFQYDARSIAEPYTEGVAHWPILLDQHGNIRVKKTDWQANRTVVAKDHNKNILVFTTEGGFFTLYNFGRFLRDQKAQFHVDTAMNMDGGYEAQMIIQKDGFRYVTYGQFETYGPGRDATIPHAKIRIPTVVGVFPRN